MSGGGERGGGGAAPFAARGGRDRELGIIECFQAVIQQCPNGSARALAEAALASLKRRPGAGATALTERAFLLLTAVRGWRGERALQVMRSLEAFLAAAPRPGGAAPAAPSPSTETPAGEEDRGAGGRAPETPVAPGRSR